MGLGYRQDGVSYERLRQLAMDATPFKKGEDVEKSTGKIGEVLESDSTSTLVEWRDGSESRVATSSLRKFTSSWGHGTKPY